MAVTGIKGVRQSATNLNINPIVFTTTVATNDRHVFAESAVAKYLPFQVFTLDTGVSCGISQVVANGTTENFSTSASSPRSQVYREDMESVTFFISIHAALAAARHKILFWS